MKRFIATLAALGLSLYLQPGSIGKSAAAQRVEVTGLASIYSLAGGAVRDTNGDGLADSVAARVIVAADPAVEDIQAAANIAGRLGFETTALSLPIVWRAPDVAQPAAVALPIIIGRSNQFVTRLVERGAIDLKSLKKGQGLLAVVAKASY